MADTPACADLLKRLDPAAAAVDRHLWLMEVVDWVRADDLPPQASIERLQQRGVINQRATRHIDQHGTGFTVRKSRGVKQVFCIVRQWQQTDNRIGLRHRRLQRRIFTWFLLLGKAAHSGQVFGTLRPATDLVALLKQRQRDCAAKFAKPQHTHLLNRPNTFWFPQRIALLFGKQIQAQAIEIQHGVHIVDHRTGKIRVNNPRQR